MYICHIWLFSIRRKKGRQPTCTDTSRNSPPRDSTCSFTAGLTSYALTIAPMLLAVPTADKPATPPPMMNTFAGGTLPAAVICPDQKKSRIPFLVFIISNSTM